MSVEMGTSVEISSLSWIAFDKRRKETNIVVIPTGAVEVYGPHLPLGSDSIVANGVAKRVALALKALVTPLIPVGDSSDLMSFPGTLTVTPEAFLNYLEGICQSLVQWNFRNFIFINSHLGNVVIIDQVAKSLKRQHDSKCMQVDWWRYSARICEDLLMTPWAAGHGGELGTAVLLYLAEELVDMEKMVDFIPDPNPWSSGLDKYVNYKDVTETGVLGIPTAANRKQGKDIVERSVKSIVEDAIYTFNTTV